MGKWKEWPLKVAEGTATVGTATVNDPKRTAPSMFPAPPVAKRKGSKYRNTPCERDGIRFDSLREADRWAQLEQMLAAGVIRNLRRQVPFVLAPAAIVAGGKCKQRVYVADSVYEIATGETVVEDVKGMLTPMYRFKRHLMKTIHGIDILEVR